MVDVAFEQKTFCWWSVFDLKTSTYVVIMHFGKYGADVSCDQSFSLILYVLS